MANAGKYKGYDITAGSDEAVSAQMAAIDKGHANLASRYATPSPTPPPMPPPPTPPTGTPPTPPTGSSGGSSGLVRSPIQVGQNGFMENAAAYFKSLSDPQSLDEIRNSMRSSMQGVIDTINVEYDKQRSGQLEENARLEARTRALNLSGGLAGSDFASAAAANTERKGKEELNLIERERTARIGTVLSGVEDRAREEFRFERSEARQNLKDYVDFYRDRQTQARADLDTLAKAGVSLDQLTPDEYKKLLNQSGFDDFMLKATYNSMKNAAQKIDYQWQINGNKIFGYGLDPITGKIATLEQELPFAVPTNFKPQFLDNGTMIFYPENIDPSKPVQDQILTYDTGSPNDTKFLREVRGGLYNTRTNTWVIGPSSEAGDDPALMRDLQDAASAIEAGADPLKVRQRFLDAHPNKGTQFNNYTKQEF